MKNILREHWLLPTLLSLAFLVGCFTPTLAQTICNNQTGSQGGYTYEYWKDNGSGCMVLGSGGAFSIQWSNINNLLARKGLRPGSMNQTVTYGADYQPNGNSYLCVYGWTTSPLVEYYIVESWGNWRPPGGSGYMGQVTSDGGTYDIYRTLRENQPSIIGQATFYQYWSVRTSKRTSGTVTCANHFNAWASHGMNMGSLYEVSFTVEGYQSSGNANVYSMSMGTGGNPNPDPDPNPNPGSNNIVVRARGTNGSEQIRLSVGGTTVNTWTLSTGYQNYTASTNSTGGVNVEFINDANGRDVQVDYIQVNGSTRQSENQATNTGVYQNGSCGGSNSEWLHCNGYIGYGNVSGGNPNPTPSGTTIVVRARGTNGSEQVRLTVGGTQVGSWTMSTSMQNYTATTTNTGGINVEFTNDASNRDVQVDYITVNGSTRQAESQGTNTGVYQNGSCGGSNSEWLHCNGYIGFGNTPSNARMDNAPEETVAETNTLSALRVYPNPASNGTVLTIDFAGVEGAHHVAFTDLNGRILKESGVENRSSIDMEVNAPAGLYLVRVNGLRRQITEKVCIK